MMQFEGCDDVRTHANQDPKLCWPPDVEAFIFGQIGIVVDVREMRILHVNLLCSLPDRGRPASREWTDEQREALSQKAKRNARRIKAREATRR